MQYVGDNIAMQKGHMNQERKKLRSTRIDSNTVTLEEFFPSQIPTPKRYLVASNLIPHASKHKAFGDLAGQFPFKLSRGHRYIYLLYDHDSNANLVEPVQNRQAQTLAKAWKTLTDRLWQRGHPYSHFVLDNKLSTDLVNVFKKYDIKYECVPPNLHGRNLAESAFQTFKNLLLAGLATCNRPFPIQEWDHLLPQTKMTLNMLRCSRNNPQLSAYSYLFGNYDYNAHPMVPPGTKVMVHSKPNNRKSWEYHGKLGWYVGPSLGGEGTSR